MKLTIAFITGRDQPHLDWMLESLAPQILARDQIEILVIDARGRSLVELDAASADFHIRVSKPMPTIWQGEHRVTSCDWWAKSAASNTAFVLCETDYIAFCDDSCRLGSKWLETARRGERARASVLAGSYDKRERGALTPDSRRDVAPAGKIDCGGGWLFGCTFALPLAWALAVNGFETGCDGLGGEDYIFGLMLANSGRRIDFVPDMRVTQERCEVSSPTAARPGMRRTDKGISPNDKSHRALARFGLRKRTEFTPDLTALRAHVRKGGPFPIPDPLFDHRDWYDGELIRDMV